MLETIGPWSYVSEFYLTVLMSIHVLKMLVHIFFRIGKYNVYNHFVERNTKFLPDIPSCFIIRSIIQHQVCLFKQTATIRKYIAGLPSLVKTSVHVCVTDKRTEFLIRHILYCRNDVLQFLERQTRIPSVYYTFSYFS